MELGWSMMSEVGKDDSHVARDSGMKVHTQVRTQYKTAIRKRKTTFYRLSV